jgi:mono/diheme cytochrome c family protein
MLKRIVTRLVTALAVVLAITLSTVMAQDQGGRGGDRRGWTIPEGAAKEPNPIPVSSEVLEKGKKIFEKKCERCHGKSGTGDGPDAEPDHPPGNLTDPERIPRNPDGVMYYKIWNGRKSPKMPAFKSEGLSQDEVWQVIHYAKTFRK